MCVQGLQRHVFIWWITDRKKTRIGRLLIIAPIRIELRSSNVPISCNQFLGHLPIPHQSHYHTKHSDSVADPIMVSSIVVDICFKMLLDTYVYHPWGYHEIICSPDYSIFWQYSIIGEVKNLSTCFPREPYLIQFSDSNPYSGVKLRRWTFQWDLAL